MSPGNATINIHIEGLVLYGIDVPANRRRLLQSAVETELARLFTHDSPGVDGLRSRDGLSRVSGGEIQLAPDSGKDSQHPGDPGKLGKKIAGAVKQGVEP